MIIIEKFQFNVEQTFYVTYVFLFNGELHFYFNKKYFMIILKNHHFILMYLYNFLFFLLHFQKVEYLYYIFNSKLTKYQIYQIQTFYSVMINVILL